MISLLPAINQTLPLLAMGTHRPELGDHTLDCRSHDKREHNLRHAYLISGAHGSKWHSPAAYAFLVITKGHAGSNWELQSGIIILMAMLLLRSRWREGGIKREKLKREREGERERMDVSGRHRRSIDTIKTNRSILWSGLVQVGHTQWRECVCNRTRKFQDKFVTDFSNIPGYVSFTVSNEWCASALANYRHWWFSH